MTRDTNDQRALLVCNDNAARARGVALCDLLAGPGRPFAAADWLRDDRSPAARPAAYALAFVHASDLRTLWKPAVAAGVTAGTVYLFNGPGDPPALPGMIPVLRPTTEPFDLTAADIVEAADFAAGRRSQLPAMCRPRVEPEILPALTILCQGYLAVHADPADGAPDPRLTTDPPAYNDVAAALARMGWTDMVRRKQPGVWMLRADLESPDARRRLQDEVEQPAWWADILGPTAAPTAKREWSDGPADGWPPVAALLDLVRADRSVPPRVVAAAYLRLADRLGPIGGAA